MESKLLLSIETKLYFMDVFMTRLRQDVEYKDALGLDNARELSRFRSMQLKYQEECENYNYLKFIFYNLNEL